MPVETPHPERRTAPNEILTRDECREIFDAVLHAAGGRDVEAIIGSRSEALTRFANNSIHQNVSEHCRWLSVRVQLNHKTARATTNRFDDDSIRRAIEEAAALASAV